MRDDETAGAARGEAGLAAALRAGSQEAVAAVGSTVLRVRRDNLVERPWGGTQLLAYKGLADDATHRGRRYGEAFEIAACRDDPEARAHPSVVQLADGSELHLPVLLDVAGDAVLGARFVEAYGHELPLLPKTLNIKELLSVQLHPPGNPELYVILAAEAGATIRLGLRRDVDLRSLEARLLAGRGLQEELLQLLGPDVDEGALGSVLGPSLQQGRSTADLVTALTQRFRYAASPRLTAALETLRGLYAEVLDLMHELPVRPGQVILNAAPQPDGAGPDHPLSADLHALGCSAGREILMLEVRRPGPTLRAWDHVRFPLRQLAISETVSLMTGQATPADHYEVEPVEQAPGVWRSVASDAFIVDHLRPQAGSAVVLASDGLPRTLHAIRGEVAVEGRGGAQLVRLRAGESALVPASLGASRVVAAGEAEVVQVTVPLPPSAGGAQQ